ASSSEQLCRWLGEWQVAPAPIAPLPIQTIVPSAEVEGPVEEFADEIRELHRRLYRK
ncbi:MAG TPA: tRNA-specific adenosine deaminase, partial [Cobetia sp.]|nr:tRNA-specific adenosine deaminase [Cobetia sp.]